MKLLPAPVGSKSTSVAVKDGKIPIVGLNHLLRGWICHSGTGIRHGTALLEVVGRCRCAQKIVKISVRILHCAPAFLILVFGDSNAKSGSWTRCGFAGGVIERALGNTERCIRLAELLDRCLHGVF